MLEDRNITVIKISKTYLYIAQNILTYTSGSDIIYMKYSYGGEMRMKYVAPEMNVVMFEAEEVICASAAPVVTTTEEPEAIPGDQD